MEARIDSAKTKLEKTVKETKALEAEHKEGKADSKKTEEKPVVKKVEKPAPKKEEKPAEKKEEKPSTEKKVDDKKGKPSPTVEVAKK